MKNWTRKAFTLIELLIVIAIIGILAVTVVLAINPGEAQKKARDTQRLKDATTLQAAIEQLIDSGVAVPNTANTLGDITAAGGVGAESHTDGTPVGGTDCNANWMGVDVCAFVNRVPIDPRNNITSAASNGTSATATAQTLLFYRAYLNGGNYEINVRQESASNWRKLVDDGGNAAAWYEVFNTDNTLL